MPLLLARAAVVTAAMILACAPVPAAAQGAQRVYVMVADSVPMPVAAAATAIAGALSRQGWTVLADHPVGTDASRCSYTGRVIVAHKGSHAAARLAHGAPAAYAVPVRVAIFDDEHGVHVAMVNPLNIERTIAAETGLEGAGRSLIDEVTTLVAAATHGQTVSRPYGQSRNRGLIGKTMGVMAGGAFASQLKTLSVSDAADLRRVADDTWRRLQQPSRGKWQLHGIYRLDLAEQGLVILGVSGSAMESRAFDIVAAGGDNTRSKFKCPGLAYAAAFPLEVVLRRDGTQVRAEAIDAMYRMKMYFEDAGQMKFARNMLMPGSIADELKGIVAGRAP